MEPRVNLILARRADSNGRLEGFKVIVKELPDRELSRLGIDAAIEVREDFPKPHLGVLLRSFERLILLPALAIRAGGEVIDDLPPARAAWSDVAFHDFLNISLSQGKKTRADPNLSKSFGCMLIV